MMQSVPKAASACLILGLLLLPAHRIPAEDWPAWRGGHAQGVMRQVPFAKAWPSKDTVNWAVPILGEGHSSPIVYGDSIYVTTAYPVQGSSWLANSFGYVQLALVAILLGLAIATTNVNSEADSTRRSATTIVKELAVWASSGWLVTIAVFGEHLFDTARCDIRSWILAVDFASLCLIEATLLGNRNDITIRRGLGLTALGLAVFSILAMPHKDHAFRGGLLSNQTMVVVMTACVPLCVSLYWLFVQSPFRRKVSSCWPITTSQVIRVFLVALVAGGMTITVIWWLTHDDESMFHENMDQSVYVIGWPWLPVSSAVLLAGVTIRCRRSEWKWARWLVPAVAGLWAVSIGMKSLEQVANISRFYRYELGNPKWQSTYPPLALAAFGLAAVVVAVGLPVWGRRFPRSSAQLPRVIHVVAVVLATWTLGGLAQVQNERLGRSWANAIVCLDRKTGQQRWVTEGIIAPQPQLDRRNSGATPTPAADRGRVVGYFGSKMLFCVDMAGRVLWRSPVIPYEGYYGVAASPVTADGVVIVAALNLSPQPSVWGLDLETGAVLWHQQWPEDVPLSGNNRTPMVCTVGGAQAGDHLGQPNG